jgi:hypothetical protein
MIHGDGENDDILQEMIEIDSILVVEVLRTERNLTFFALHLGEVFHFHGESSYAIFHAPLSTVHELQPRKSLRKVEFLGSGFVLVQGMYVMMVV